MALARHQGRQAASPGRHSRILGDCTGAGQKPHPETRRMRYPKAFFGIKARPPPVIFSACSQQCTLKRGSWKGALSGGILVPRWDFSEPAGIREEPLNLRAQSTRHGAR